jgi:putative aminopeptidase FrvX
MLFPQASTNTVGLIARPAITITGTGTTHQPNLARNAQTTARAAKIPPQTAHYVGQLGKLHQNRRSKLNTRT